MFKKLTSFFFKEEEIEVEDIQDEVVEDYSIPELKVYTPTPKVEEIKEKVEIKDQEVTMPKKTMMIDLDDPKPHLEEKGTVTILKETHPYQIKEVLSPIHGGPKIQEEKVPVKNVSVKSRKPLTEIISPIYGKVEAPQSELKYDTELLDLGVEDLIASPTSSLEEQQISLHDIFGDETHEE